VRSQTTATGDNPKLLGEDYWKQMVETLTAEAGPASRHSAHRATHKVASAQ
jgi:hypothetical protein